MGLSGGPNAVYQDVNIYLQWERMVRALSSNLEIEKKKLFAKVVIRGLKLVECVCPTYKVKNKKEKREFKKYIMTGRRCKCVQVCVGKGWEMRLWRRGLTSTWYISILNQHTPDAARQVKECGTITTCLFNVSGLPLKKTFLLIRERERFHSLASNVTSVTIFLSLSPSGLFSLFLPSINIPHTSSLSTVLMGHKTYLVLIPTTTTTTRTFLCVAFRRKFFFSFLFFCLSRFGVYSRSQADFPIFVWEGWAGAHSFIIFEKSGAIKI